MKEFFKRFHSEKELSKKKKRIIKEHDHLTEIKEHSYDGNSKVIRLNWKDDRGHSAELFSRTNENKSWFSLIKVNYSTEGDVNFLSFDSVCQPGSSRIANAFYDEQGLKQETFMWSWKSTWVLNVGRTIDSHIPSDTMEQLGLLYEDELPDKIDISETVKHFQKQLVAGDFSPPTIFSVSE